MKSMFRTTALTVACVAGLACSASAASVSQVRQTQERLANLGYDVGPQDGVMGEQTKAALMDFQARSGLAVTGKLTADTSDMLKQTNVYAWRSNYGYAPAAYGYNGYYNGGYAYNGVVPAWNTAYGAVAQAVPNRFASVAIHAAHAGSVGNYTVAVNGQPVLVANNQPAPLRVSRSYQLNGEDAMIFTSYDGNSSCNYKNYLVTVRGDGTYTTPREVGNCSGSYQASVQNGTLVIGFPTGQYANSSTMWDNWTYNGASLAHM